MSLFRSHRGWYAICRDCLKASPAGDTSSDARVLAKDAGWSRVYPGRGEAFRCPDCRRRGPSTPQSRMPDD